MQAPTIPFSEQCHTYQYVVVDADRIIKNNSLVGAD